MRKTILALGIASLLSACVNMPDYTLPNTDIPATTASAAVDAQWWHTFADPTLDQLIAAAVANNQNLAMATAKLAEARAVLGIASAEQLPRVDLGGGAARQRTSQEGTGKPSQTYDYYKLAGSVSWELDLWGRVRNTAAAAQQSLLANQYNRDAVQLALQADVAQTYFNLRTLDRQLAITDATIQSRQEALDLRQKRFKGGMTSELDVRQAEVELAAAQASRPALVKAIAKAEGALAVLTGASPRQLVEQNIARGTAMGQFSAPAPLPAALDSDLLLRRPDIAQAESVLLGSRASIQAARAAYYPRISLTGLLGLESMELSNLFQGSAKAWSFAGNLAMPLFDNGLTAAQVDQAKAREQQAAAAYQLAVQNAFSETRAAIVADQVALDKLKAEQQQVTALERQLKLATLRYDNGFSSYLEVLDAQRSLFTSQLNYTQAQSDLLISRVQLYKALGGGWQKPSKS